jgi:DNA-binding winged helix-turn-helix (wHTH) protein
MTVGLAQSQSLGATRLNALDSADAAVAADLLAKVEALLHRPTDGRETILSVGPLQLDLLTRTVCRGARSIDLLPREYQLLEYMVKHQGELVTRAMLFREVWNYTFVPKSNLVDVHMGRLRRKIDRRDETPMIYSIRGRGFVLRAPVWLHPSRPACATGKTGQYDDRGVPQGARKGDPNRPPKRGRRIR